MFRQLKVSRLLASLAALPLLSAPVLAAERAGQTPPAPTAAGQSIASVANSAYPSGFAYSAVTLPYSVAGDQATFPGPVVIAPTGSAENGLTVNMPSGATGYSYLAKTSTGAINFAVGYNPNFGGFGMSLGGLSPYPYTFYDAGNASIAGVTISNGSIAANSYGGAYNNFFSTSADADGYQFACYSGNAYAGGRTNGGVLLLRQYGAYSGDYLNLQTSAKVSFARLSSGGALTSAGYVLVNPVATPAAPTITQGGTAGSTIYYYRVSAVSGTGETLASAEVNTATGAATLSSTNYNKLTWTPTPGAESYNIYRSAAAGNEQKIASTTGSVWAFSAASYSDTGSASSGALPSANTTGYINSPIYQTGGVPATQAQSPPITQANT